MSESDLHQYYTLYSDSAGVLIPHQADTIFDINDNDNFHQLCLSTMDTIVKVDFQANIVEDPNADPNAFTEIELSYCPSTMTTGLGEYQSPFELSVFPNPAKETVYLNLSDTRFEVNLRIYALSGTLLLEKYLGGTQLEQVDLSTLSAGYYLLDCSNPQIHQSQILIIQK